MGYLSALVDIDQLEFLQEVAARTDLERLQQQLARAKSIADARHRAYLKRKDDFVAQQQALCQQLEQREAERIKLETQLADSQQLALIQAEIASLQKRIEEEQASQSELLSEQSADLQFYDDQVEVVEQLLEREEIAQSFEQDAPRREISGLLTQNDARSRLLANSGTITARWQRLRQLLDKWNELQVRQQQARQTYNYFEAQARDLPSSITITVNNKDGIDRKLTKSHSNQIAAALSIMPAEFKNRIRNIYIVNGGLSRRGMSGVGVVFMKGEEQDFFRVLVHEFGHIWDLHRESSSTEMSQFFDGQYRLPQDDPSVTFYQYSWRNNFEMIEDDDAFASGYGKSDPFEDFGEVFALYILQGRTFLDWQNSNSVMANKYRFMQSIFNNKTFPSSGNYYARPYDVTLMKVDYQELLGMESVATNR